MVFISFYCYMFGRKNIDMVNIIKKQYGIPI